MEVGLRSHGLEDADNGLRIDVLPLTVGSYDASGQVDEQRVVHVLQQLQSTSGIVG